MNSTDLNEDRLARAIALFEYLSRVQSLKQTRTRHIDTYRSAGAVHWLSALPEHWAVSLPDSSTEMSLDVAVLTLDRVPRHEMPPPPPMILQWLTTDADDPSVRPSLREVVSRNIDISPTNDDDESATEVVKVSLDDHPDVRPSFEKWISHWDLWSAQELQDRPAREAYADLYSTYVAADAHPEELELVLGTGLVGWVNESGESIQRHLLTAPVSIQFDDETGRLTLEVTRAGLSVETDMLDPSQISHPEPVKVVKEEAADTDIHPLDRDSVGLLVRRIVHTLAPDGQFEDSDERPSAAESPSASLAPAVILRKRSQLGMTEIYESIVGHLKEAGEVPSGLLPLVDPDHEVSVEPSEDLGALLDVEGDPFLPLPVNDRQLEIIRRVDVSAQVLVQGPPGTGKTHTAAALLSNLLAQGKRVLVTAHTDRALYEVRAKLPQEIRPLSVSVIGASQSDMADLKLAVDRISQAASDFDASTSLEQENEILADVDRLSRRRAELYRRLVDVRQSETVTHQRDGQEQSLAQVAQRHESQSDQHGWIASIVSPQPGQAAPLSSAEAMDLLNTMLDEVVNADEAEARQYLTALDLLPDHEAFTGLCEAELLAHQDNEAHVELTTHESLDGIRSLPDDVRHALQHRVATIAKEAAELGARHESWMNDALNDVRGDRAGIWEKRLEQVTNLIQQAEVPIQTLGPIVHVTIGDADTGRLDALARTLHSYLSSGKTIKTTADGHPRLGALTPSIVKQSAALFDSVRVDGLPPTTLEHINQVGLTLQATRALEALDRAWPSSVEIPEEDTLAERLQWHVTESAQLRRVLDLAAALTAESQEHRRLNLTSPDWTDLRSIVTFGQLVDVAAGQERLEQASSKVDDLSSLLQRQAELPDANGVMRDMHEAVAQRDTAAYALVHARLHHLHAVRTRLERFDRSLELLMSDAPDLVSSMAESVDAPEWHERFSKFEEAWAWAETAAWIRAHDTDDVNILQSQVTDVERLLRAAAERLAANRAWRHAVAPERMSGRTRADLTSYSQLVRRLGKGTGKYAAKQRAEIRIAMDRCRGAVPVWIMPIYRIAEQLSVSENMFDVVIVDEASQAGLDATFLQYLAPRIVVIGDDKQVSPSAVGIDQSELRDLANQYIPNDRYREQWVNPQRSFFDEAAMRFPKRIVLTEHRRCMPEIIGFSNRIAYEPEGVRLDPVRQYGADRLAPLKAVHVSDGYEDGKINRPEAEAIVEQIQKCLADPAYDGMTFGVISLLGNAQAKHVERLLIESVDPEEMSARQIRCGDSNDFQGSERDVIFLSMVKALTPGKRIGALTQASTVQRYNVAASRAKDQMWLFHSVTLNDLGGNPDDMRTALLEYVYGVIQRGNSIKEESAFGTVPEDLLVEPFDSLFEQRVFNRILDRGYTVQPQVESLGYRLDLVIIGSGGRVAVECDGDHWHGPEAYHRDVKRQRDLERCGWRIFRIRESLFYTDRAAAMESLWEWLNQLDIRPAGWTPPEPEQLQPSPSSEHQEGLDYLEDGPDSGVPGGESDPDKAVPLDGPLTATVGQTQMRELSSPSPLEAAVVLPEQPLGSSTLEPYGPFEGSVPPIGSASREEVVHGLVRIVEAEGPVVGHRLHRAYVLASGGQRVGKQIGQEINRALSSALRAGQLIADDPLGEAGLRPQTFRTPAQPDFRSRTLGPRDLEQVPPLELLALMDRLAGEAPVEPGVLFRSVLAELGLKRLTNGVEARLVAIEALRGRRN